MVRKLIPGLLGLVIGCQGSVCDTGDPLAREDIDISINERSSGNYKVVVKAPESVYGMYLITGNGSYGTDQVTCKKTENFVNCRWDLKNDEPLGVRLYDSCSGSLEVFF